MSLENGFGEQRKTDRQTGSNPRPPQRRDRTSHLLLAHPADNLIDERRRQPRTLLDGLDVAFADRFGLLPAGFIRPISIGYYFAASAEISRLKFCRAAAKGLILVHG